MVSILLNATLTHDGEGYVRKLALHFTGDKKLSWENLALLPGMVRPEVAQALRTFADQIEAHDAPMTT